jgi:hypothetical protein
VYDRPAAAGIALLILVATSLLLAFAWLTVVSGLETAAPAPDATAQASPA